MTSFTWITYIALSVVFVLFAIVVLWKIFRMNLEGLISEGGGKASLSRFQFLVFTFVVAGLFMILCLETGQFIEVPNGVLALIGISAGSYVGSKVTQKTATVSKARAAAAQAAQAPQAPPADANPPSGNPPKS